MLAMSTWFYVVRAVCSRFYEIGSRLGESCYVKRLSESLPITPLPIATTESSCLQLPRRRSRRIDWQHRLAAGHQELLRELA